MIKPGTLYIKESIFTITGKLWHSDIMLEKLLKFRSYRTLTKLDGKVNNHFYQPSPFYFLSSDYMYFKKSEKLSLVSFLVLEYLKYQNNFNLFTFPSYYRSDILVKKKWNFWNNFFIWSLVPSTAMIWIFCKNVWTCFFFCKYKMQLRMVLPTKADYQPIYINSCILLKLDSRLKCCIQYKNQSISDVFSFHSILKQKKIWEGVWHVFENLFKIDWIWRLFINKLKYEHWTASVWVN